MKMNIIVAAMAILIIISGLVTGISEDDSPDAALTVSLGGLSSPYTWYDDILVTATVTLSGSPAMGCEVIATCAINPTETGTLRDDGIAPDAVANNGVYTGHFRIGGANGSAVPAQDNNVLVVTATRPGDSGGAQATFNVRAAERWTGVSTDAPGAYPDSHDTYTNFVVTKTGTGWHHRIENFGVYWYENAKSGTTIRVPIFPKTNTVSNVTVTNGNEAQVIDNVIQFKATLARRTTTRFTIEFDTPSDLAATYIDRYNTGHIGLRQFRNGFIVWNAHVSQAIFGSPNISPHGQGVNCGMQVLEKSTGLMRSVDCMERVAIVYDGALFNSGDASYPYNIKWEEQIGNSWLVSADLSQITFRLRSKTTYCDGKLAIDKTIQFHSDEHYVRQNYTIENVDTVPHSATIVWGREQWMYGNTTMLDANDRGFVGTEPTIYGSGYRREGAAMAERFFGAIDIDTYYSLAMIFPSENDLPTYMYFLESPPLAPTYGTYPIDYSVPHLNNRNTFFEMQFGSIPAGGKAYSEFYMWGGYGASVADLQGMVAADAQKITNTPTFEIPLNAGWNLVSIPLELADTSVENVLSSISADWEVVKFYHPETKAWMTHRQGSSANTLDNIDLTMGFWLHATEACTLSVSGTVPASTAINLHAGWNLVGYPSGTPRVASVALAGTDATIISIYQSASPFIEDRTDLSTVIMEAGNGYWVKVPADTLWTVNW